MRFGVWRLTQRSFSSSFAIELHIPVQRGLESKFIASKVGWSALTGISLLP
jgi:hypothetical protein